MFDWVLGIVIGYQLLGIGDWLLGTGYLLDTRCWMLDAGTSMSHTKKEARSQEPEYRRWAGPRARHWLLAISYWGLGLLETNLIAKKLINVLAVTNIINLNHLFVLMNFVNNPVTSGPV